MSAAVSIARLSEAKASIAWLRANANRCTDETLAHGQLLALKVEWDAQLRTLRREIQIARRRAYTHGEYVAPNELADAEREVERAASLSQAIQLGVSRARLRDKAAVDEAARRAGAERLATRPFGTRFIVVARRILSPDVFDEVERETREDGDPPDEETTREVAIAAAQRLATEVARLEAALKEAEAAARDREVLKAFKTVAQLVLAEGTYQRILDRARDRASVEHGE